MKRLLWMTVLGAGLCVGLCKAQEAAGEAKKEATQHAEGAEDSLTIWRWANFLILAGGLAYLIGKSVPAMLKTRSADIQKGISEGQRLKADAEARAAGIEQKISKLGSEIQAFRAESVLEMEKEGQRILQETAKAIEKLQSQAAAEVESAGKAARAELKQYAAGLSIDLAARRIQAGLDSGTEAGLVDGFIGDLARQRSKN